MNIYLTFRSLTAAQQAKRTLQGRGIRAELVRTPKHLQTNGCGYSLRLSEADYPKARPLPSGVQRVFTVRRSGTVEVTPP